MKSSIGRLQQLLNIKNASFARVSHGANPNNVFTKPIASFVIHSPPSSPHFWAVTGPMKTDLLKVAAGQYIPHPPRSRVYPLLSDTFQYQQIQFLNFTDASGLDKVHLLARYESFSYKGVLEMSDDVNSVRNYITGANNYNSNLDSVKRLDENYIGQLMKLFNLELLQNKWINSLSNGQMRRARIAKALVNKPNVLLVDDPFLGLDPDATEMVSRSLHDVASQFGIAVVLGLRVQDQVPEWVQNVAYVDPEGIAKQGTRREMVEWVKSKVPASDTRVIQQDKRSGKPVTNDFIKSKHAGTSPMHIEFLNASVVYKGQPVLLGFDWVVPRGSKWRILGDNGTGKTTILLLITADHPQSWKSVLSIDGILRKAGSGSSFFDINNRVGISSPELHALVPGGKTMKQVILSGAKHDVGNSNFMFVEKEENLSDFGHNLLAKFQDRLDKYGDAAFRDLQLTDQKLTLFLRAAIKKPEILILDEAFSCMDDANVMHRCHELVNSWNDMTVLSIGHIDWELPRCDYVLKLEGGGRPARVEELIQAGDS